jgi:hypothetical protein
MATTHRTRGAGTNYRGPVSRYRDRALRLQAEVGEILIHDSAVITPMERKILLAAMEVGKRLAHI